VLHIAQQQVQQIAPVRGMDGDQVVAQLPNCIFTVEIPDAPTITNH
jgi:hypothetical protein